MVDGHVKVGFVGCGRISKRHFEAIADNGNISIGVVCDVNEEKAVKASRELGVPYVLNISEIHDVDVITIATPSGMHPRNVIQTIMETDASLIVCEKPVSLTVREAVEMYKIAQKKGKTILPVYQNRYNPLVSFTKSLIQSGALGKVYQFNVNVFWNRNDDYFVNNGWHGTIDLDGGVLYTQASHYVDMLHFFFGNIKEAKGLGNNLRGFETQDSVSAVLQFECGTVGSLNATVCTYRENYRTEATIIAEKGTIRLSGTNLNTIEFWDVDGMDNPGMDFTLYHQYGKGHNMLYEYIVKKEYTHFPSYEDVLSGIALMEKLTY